MECMLEKNLSRCNCTYEPCSKKGKCCECIAYHKGMGQLPACFFDASSERTYDRSIARFMQSQRSSR